MQFKDDYDGQDDYSISFFWESLQERIFQGATAFVVPQVSNQDQSHQPKDKCSLYTTLLLEPSLSYCLCSICCKRIISFENVTILTPSKFWSPGSTWNWTPVLKLISVWPRHSSLNATLLLILLNKKNKEICLSCNLIPWNIDWEINEFSSKRVDIFRHACL